MGNTTSNRQSLRIPTVHPHVHGEHTAGSRVVLNGIGSSPRTWGTQRKNLRCIRPIRFIPTYMGNTTPGRARGAAPAVHPHVHGEHAMIPVAGNIRIGSSPRTWGTRTSGNSPRLPHRFIPTCMGNTTPGRSRSPSITVHPHVHGEHGDQKRVITDRDGSSPRAWGTLDAVPQPG